MPVLDSRGGLIARCRAGDDDAWRELVERHARYVHAIAVRAYGRQPADAEDVLPETFARAYEHLDTLRDDDAIGAWIGATRGAGPRRSRCAWHGSGCSDQHPPPSTPAGQKEGVMSEQPPEKAALNEEPEVEGHKQSLRPEELVEEEGPEVEGHLRLASPEDPLRKG